MNEATERFSRKMTVSYWPRMNHVTAMFVLVAMATVLTVSDALETHVPMDKDNNKCGNVFVLGPSQDVRLTGTGFVPDGYCGVTVYAPPEVGNYTCDAVCVTFKTISWATCDVKLKFVGHKFRKEGDIVKEYNCHNRDKSSFCMDVSSLRVEVVEEYIYAYKPTKPLYEFNVDANARCTKDAVAKKMYHASKEETEAQEMRTYGQGIAVGVSLACIFLVVLFVAWCYTKHQAVSGGSSSSDGGRGSSRKKGNLISSFRAKLHTKKKSDASEEPQATYRKTEPAYVAPPPKQHHDDPEAATELSPLTESTKEASAETYELASETPKPEERQKSEEKSLKEATPPNESPKDGGQESPKDGGDDATKSTNVDPVPLATVDDLDPKTLEDSPV